MGLVGGRKEGGWVAFGRRESFLTV